MVSSAEVGPAAVVSSELIVLATVGALMLIGWAIEVAEHRLRGEVEAELLRALLRELTAAGLASFLLFAIKAETAPLLSASVLHDVETVHLLVAAVAVMHAVIVVGLLAVSFRLSRQWSRWEEEGRPFAAWRAHKLRLLAMQGELAFLEPERMDDTVAAAQRALEWEAAETAPSRATPCASSCCSRGQRRAGWCTRRCAVLGELCARPGLVLSYHRVLARARLVELRHWFVHELRLPASFRFAAYLRRAKASTFKELVRVPLTLWAMVLLAVLVDATLRDVFPERWQAVSLEKAATATAAAVSVTVLVVAEAAHFAYWRALHGVGGRALTAGARLQLASEWKTGLRVGPRPAGPPAAAGEPLPQGVSRPVAEQGAAAGGSGVSLPRLPSDVEVIAAARSPTLLELASARGKGAGRAADASRERAGRASSSGRRGWFCCPVVASRCRRIVCLPLTLPWRLDLLHRLLQTGVFLTAVATALAIQASVGVPSHDSGGSDGAAAHRRLAGAAASVTTGEADGGWQLGMWLSLGGCVLVQAMALPRAIPWLVLASHARASRHGHREPSWHGRPPAADEGAAAEATGPGWERGRSGSEGVSCGHVGGSPDIDGDASAGGPDDVASTDSGDASAGGPDDVASTDSGDAGGASSALHTGVSGAAAEPRATQTVQPRTPPAADEAVPGPARRRGEPDQRVRLRPARRSPGRGSAGSQSPRHASSAQGPRNSALGTDGRPYIDDRLPALRATLEQLTRGVAASARSRLVARYRSRLGEVFGPPTARDRVFACLHRTSVEAALAVSALAFAAVALMRGRSEDGDPSSWPLWAMQAVAAAAWAAELGARAWLLGPGRFLCGAHGAHRSLDAAVVLACCVMLAVEASLGLHDHGLSRAGAVCLVRLLRSFELMGELWADEHEQQAAEGPWLRRRVLGLRPVTAGPGAATASAPGTGTEGGAAPAEGHASGGRSPRARTFMSADFGGLFALGDVLERGEAVDVLALEAEARAAAPMEVATKGRRDDEAGGGVPGDSLDIGADVADEEVASGAGAGTPRRQRSRRRAHPAIATAAVTRAGVDAARRAHEAVLRQSRRHVYGGSGLATVGEGSSEDEAAADDGSSSDGSLADEDLIAVDVSQIGAAD